MRPQWEYKVLCTVVNEDILNDWMDLQKLLNEYGTEGYEVFRVDVKDSDSTYKKFTVWFKRPKES